MVQEQVEIIIIIKKIFGTSYRDTKSSEKSGSGTKSRATAKPKFLLGW